MTEDREGVILTLGESLSLVVLCQTYHYISLCFALRSTVQHGTCYSTVHRILIGLPHSSFTAYWLLVRFYWENNTDPATATASPNHHQPAPRQ